mmetsp:Transcript_86420/g.241780  ORF Transcript_86420/g.241780 Transcript_86420/m.241780 type:complete len:201 (-) Transcript_86420:1552-2154(-)
MDKGIGAFCCLESQKLFGPAASADRQCVFKYHAQKPGTRPMIIATLSAPLATLSTPKLSMTSATARTPKTMAVVAASVVPVSRTTRLCAPWLWRSSSPRRKTKSWVRTPASVDSRSGAKVPVPLILCRSARTPSPTMMRVPAAMPIVKLMCKHFSPATAAVTKTGSSSRTTFEPGGGIKSCRASSGHPCSFMIGFCGSAP